jgi:hypothetical protein
MNLQYKTTTYNMIVPVVMVIKLQAYQNGMEKEQLRECPDKISHTRSISPFSAFPVTPSSVVSWGIVCQAPMFVLF